MSEDGRSRSTLTVYACVSVSVPFSRDLSGRSLPLFFPSHTRREREREREAGTERRREVRTAAADRHLLPHFPDVAAAATPYGATQLTHAHAYSAAASDTQQFPVVCAHMRMIYLTRDRDHIVFTYFRVHLATQAFHDSSQCCRQIIIGFHHGNASPMALLLLPAPGSCQHADLCEVHVERVSQ